MKDGRPAGVEDFATGWLKDGAVSGRPVGLVTGADGALYVADDNKGFIYRISYVPSRHGLQPIGCAASTIAGPTPSMWRAMT